MKKFKEFFVNSFFAYLAIEIVEEMLEEVITFGLSALLIKGVSTLLVVSLTQGAKVSIKVLVKRFTYKEGNDKVEKVKKFFVWIWSNKKTLLGIGSGVLMVVSGSGAIDVNSFPALLVGGFNITPIIYYVVLGILSLIGVTGKGFETIQEFAERLGVIKAKKEEKQIEKEAKKELKAEEKNANQTQAEQEKAAAKAAAEAKAKAEAEKAEAEHRAKVEAVKEKLKLQATQTATTETTTDVK